MNNQEYEQKKGECWKECIREYGYLDPAHAFNLAFDCAYALGKQEKDAEKEEMLMVPRSQMQKLYASTKKVNDPSSKDYINGILNTLDTLFGSKCQPDESVSNCHQLPEQKPAAEEGDSDLAQRLAFLNSASNKHSDTKSKPAEPKYHNGEKVCYNGYVYEVEGLVGENRYALKGLNFDLDEDMIDHYEPCTEPEEFANLSQNIVDCDKMIDDVLKDSFRNERRQTITAMAMQGILTNDSRMSRYEDMATVEPCERLTDIVARNALRYADALISECEKGGSHEKV